MTLKHFFSFFPMAAVAIAATVFSACSSKDDEPEAPAAPARLLAVTRSDDWHETYAYDRHGRIRELIGAAKDENLNIVYSYPDDKTIEITTTYSWKDQTRCLSEVAELENGRVKLIDGVEQDYQNGDMTRDVKYSCTFTYDGFNRLRSIGWTQWQPNAASPRPWRWESTLKWQDTKLLEYADGQGHEEPYITTAYTYYDSQAVGSNPLALPFIALQYTPLQMTGYFGLQPSELLRTRTVDCPATRQHDEYSYSYTYSVTATDSRLESYTVNLSGSRPVTYSLTWDD